MTDARIRKFHCLKCDHTWEVPFGTGRQLVCPRCGSMNIHRTNPGVFPPGRKGRHARRKGSTEGD